MPTATTEFVPSVDSRLYEATKRWATADTLDKLATDQDPRVRVRVVLHENTPTVTRARLASDDDVRVRWAGASTHLMPADTLHEMTADLDPLVAAVAADTLFN